MAEMTADIQAFTAMVTSQNLRLNPGRDDPHQCPHRWKSKIEYSIHGEASVAQKAKIGEWIHFLATSAGLSADPVPGTEPGRLQYHLNAAAQPATGNFRSSCSASRRIDRQCTILSATVTVPANLDVDQFDYCLRHESLHAFGIHGHPRQADSIMNPDAERNAPSDWDWYVLGLLYHPQLAHIIAIDDFLAHAETILRNENPRPGSGHVTSH